MGSGSPSRAWWASAQAVAWANSLPAREECAGAQTIVTCRFGGFVLRMRYAAGVTDPKVNLLQACCESEIIVVALVWVMASAMATSSAS